VLRLVPTNANVDPGSTEMDLPALTPTSAPRDSTIATSQAPAAKMSPALINANAHPAILVATHLAVTILTSAVMEPQSVRVMLFATYPGLIY